MSNSLVFLSSNNLPLTTTVIIADSLDKRHTDVLALTHKYENELRNFGSVPFKTELKKAGIHGAQQEAEYAYLNEQQATLLISMMRNCPKVIAFKIALVKAFYEMRKLLAQQSQTYTPDEIALIKDKAVKQGYAIACAQLKERVKQEEADTVSNEAPRAKLLKDDEIAIPKSTAKHIYEYLDWISKHRKEMMQTASDMREQSRVLMLAAEGMLVTRSLVKDSIFDKL